jgi:adenine C2-methylase RlmN of 23S rRNA A2503 and tRNA A37
VRVEPGGLRDGLRLLRDGAQMGFIRSLTAAEIVGQWYAATHVVGVRPKNIVFMGMGEPLDNYEQVMQAVAVLKDHNGVGAHQSHHDSRRWAVSTAWARRRADQAAHVAPAQPGPVAQLRRTTRCETG